MTNSMTHPEPQETPQQCSHGISITDECLQCDANLEEAPTDGLREAIRQYIVLYKIYKNDVELTDALMELVQQHVAWVIGDHPHPNDDDAKYNLENWDRIKYEHNLAIEQRLRAGIGDKTLTREEASDV